MIPTALPQTRPSSRPNSKSIAVQELIPSFASQCGIWPGYVFTGEPLNLPAGGFGLGHGNGAHAPNEYFLIESANPKVQGMDGAVKSYVEFLYAMAG